AEEFARFFADAGATLAESLDYRATLAKVARLAVPFIADMCVVDVVEPDGTMTAVAEAHADPRQEETLRGLHRRYPIGGIEVPSMIVQRTGQPYLLPPAGSDLEPRPLVPDPELAEIIRSLRIDSVMAVPLIARGNTLGVMTFCSTPGRELGPEGLALAQ